MLLCFSGSRMSSFPLFPDSNICCLIKQIFFLQNMPPPLLFSPAFQTPTGGAVHASLLVIAKRSDECSNLLMTTRRPDDKHLFLSAGARKRDKRSLRK